MPRCELELLRREASGERFEDDGAPPSSVVLPLVTRKEPAVHGGSSGL